ncbi:sodium- and chloride-dependent GABA transporter ine-like [Amphibalanus amphitrite]|uniref:sodium- and chloride-dependent GABA transporter ine-like n=1 Tax=Amphibalanus amphitrite TaxID=1232801 RepID=UPI001C91365A|nr:sodium- and chloride-dependent GABA transporter ine-like [Amphibalanus amphitrite]XP_043224466.1 sodium- and chloride-dependent GABA transporter ine-like [Amphibalanus amphitrite]
MRTNWSNKIEFVLACLGYAVGLGNLWRFPYMCYNSGGGAFLIPYYIMMFVCSIPLLLMELAVGQFTQRGPVGAMARLCPLFKGAGLATVVISFLFCSYYNVVIAWALYYMFASFQSQIPWASCNNTWNTATCHDASAADVTLAKNVTTPSEEYFYHNVLQITGGIEEIGSMRWPIFLTLLLAWILVYFSLWKSVKSSGKVVYFTVITPYVLIAVFLWRALTLEGAYDGLRFLFQPRWELLKDAKVWVNAAAQNFNSVGIAFGSMIAFASYNKVNNRSIMLDTMVICCLNSATSILAGIIVFATLGNIAHELQSKIEDVVTAGPGLVFVIYPKALAGMPVPQLWAFLFFFMLLCLGLDSQFATLEVVITTLQDAYGKWIKAYLKRHEVLVLLMCFVSFVLGLPHVMQGGMFVFQLMDYYVAGISLMFLAFFEVIAVTWVYGTERLSRDYAAMTGARPLVYFQVCWRFLAPFLILAIWIFSLIDYERPSYDGYHYPEWGIRLGWFLASLSILPIPLCAVVALCQATGSTPWQRLMNAIQPDPTLYTKPDPEYFNEGLELESGAASKADLVTVASTRGDGFPSAPPTAV